eukprot:tig00000691_g3163.t1
MPVERVALDLHGLEEEAKAFESFLARTDPAARAGAGRGALRTSQAESTTDFGAGRPAVAVAANYVAQAEGGSSIPPQRRTEILKKLEMEREQKKRELEAAAAAAAQPPAPAPASSRDELIARLLEEKKRRDREAAEAASRPASAPAAKPAAEAQTSSPRPGAAGNSPPPPSRIPVPIHTHSPPTYMHTYAQASASRIQPPAPAPAAVHSPDRDQAGAGGAPPSRIPRPSSSTAAPAAGAGRGGPPGDLEAAVAQRREQEERLERLRALIAESNKRLPPQDRELAAAMRRRSHEEPDEPERYAPGYGDEEDEEDEGEEGYDRDGPQEYSGSPPAALFSYRGQWGDEGEEERPRGARRAPQPAGRHAPPSASARGPRPSDTRTPAGRGPASRQRPSSAPRERPAPSSASKSPAASTRIEQLAQNRAQSPSRRALVARVREDELKECTFRPRINNYRPRSAPRTREQRIHQLAVPRQARAAEYERQKAEREISELKKYPFRPAINENPLIPAPPEHLRLPVEKRLTAESDSKIARREMAKREQENLAVSAHPFAPRTNRHRTAPSHIGTGGYAASRSPSPPPAERGPPPVPSEAADYKPLHERVGELQRRRNEKLMKMRVNHSLDPNCTFRPTLDQMSERIAQVVRGSEDVTTRLTKEAGVFYEKRMRRQEEWEKLQAERHPFAPRVNPTSERIALAAEEGRRTSLEAFLERQEAFVARKEQKRLEVERATQPQYTFQPDIGPNSELLLQMRPSRAGESLDERLVRLSYKDAKRKEQLRESIAEQHYKQYSFRPEINGVSRSIGPRPSSIQDLVDDPKIKRARQEAVEAAEQAFRRVYTFKPKTLRPRSAPHSRPQSPCGSERRAGPFEPDEYLKRVEREQKAKEAKLEQTRRAMEYDELRVCTFTPEIRRERPASPAGPIVVRGLARHMELRDHARRLAEEKAEREAKAFLVNLPPSAADPARGHTVPQPFKLQTAHVHAANRQRRVLAELAEKEQQACTFHPTTNEGQNRALLLRILADGDP